MTDDQIKELEEYVRNSSKTLLQACNYLGFEMPASGISLTNYTQCSQCDIWTGNKKLLKDSDGMPICRVCFTFYGD